MVREPDQMFLYNLVKKTGKIPNSEFFEEFSEMDPIIKLWMYESWLYDEERKMEQLRSQAILIGSFTNAKMANDMIKNENPDFVSSDEDFEKSVEQVKQQPVEKKRKSRRKQKVKVVKR